VFTIVPLCVHADFFTGIFDPKKKYSWMAAGSLTVISLMVVMDFLQLILAASLRGAGDVKTVMWTRFCSCIFFFMPVSYLLSTLPIENQLFKFISIYGTFYLTTGIMGVIFLRRIMGGTWRGVDIS